MNSLYIHLTSVFTIGFLAVNASCTDMESLVSTRKNFLLKGHVMQRQRTTSQLSCAHLCLRKEGCLSFNYKLLCNIKGLCELSSGAAGRFDDGLSEGEGWIYGQIVRSKPIQAVEQNNKSGKNVQISNSYFTDFLAKNGKKSAN